MRHSVDHHDAPVASIWFFSRWLVDHDWLVVMNPIGHWCRVYRNGIEDSVQLCAPNEFARFDA